MLVHKSIRDIKDIIGLEKPMEYARPKADIKLIPIMT
jgi:hypothetical protein